MNEKTLVLLGTLGTIILGVIAAALAWFLGGSALQSPNKEILRQMLNFEISLLIVGLICGFIPFVGVLIGLVLAVFNLFIAIKAFIASNNNEAFKAPSYEFIK